MRRPPAAVQKNLCTPPGCQQFVSARLNLWQAFSVRDISSGLRGYRCAHPPGYTLAILRDARTPVLSSSRE
jgi:hypothetical protein